MSEGGRVGTWRDRAIDAVNLEPMAAAAVAQGVPD